VDPDRLPFAERGRRHEGDASPASLGREAVEALRVEADVLRTNPRCESPTDFAEALGALLDDERLALLTDPPVSA